VVNININFRRSSSLGDVLDIQTRLSKIGNTSGVLRQEIYNKGTGELIADPGSIRLIDCLDTAGYDRLRLDISLNTK